MSTAGVVLVTAVAVAGWLPFVVALRRQGRKAAATVAGCWAVVLMSGFPVVEHRAPGFLARTVPGAGAYGREMLAWATTGAGCESDPACFLPQHALHAGAFAAATLASGGLFGLGAAVVLFGWMGAYAAGLAAVSKWPAVAVLLAWHPWALIRVAAYVLLGVALAEPLTLRGLPPRPGRGKWLLAGLAGLVLDAALKAAIAPWWWAHVIAPLLR